MGTWDTGLYQNDLSADVRDDYISKLKAGKSDEDALKEILEEYKEESEDDDEKYDFYLALADTLWKKGRLIDTLKNKALEILEEDKVSERWMSEKIRKERIKVLDKLKEKLESPMLERKKIPIHKPYKLGWEEGDVYCFQINSEVEGYEEYIGWYTLFYVDKIYTDDWYVRGVQDEMADLFFFLQKEKPCNADDILSAGRVKFSRGNKAYLCEASKRERPKDLTFLGKCHVFRYSDESIQPKSHFAWADNVHEREIIWGYIEQKNIEKQS